MTDIPAKVFFETSPFSVVADEAAARCWGGRGKALEGLLKIRHTLKTRPDSSLDLIWANLGAGKTHTLFHLEYLLSQDSSGGHTVCVFVEMQEQLRNFHDLYKRIVSAIPTIELSDVLSNCPIGKLPDSVARAANVFRNGGPSECALIRSWLNGEHPYLNELKKCSGITQRIEDDATAVDALCAILQAFAMSKRRLLVCIDEFQRVGVVGPRTRQQILSSLRTVFSRNPRYFSVVIAVQSMIEKNALELVPPELQTLIGRKPSISLPEMDVAEARDFLRGRFEYFRPEGYVGPAFAPFDEQAVHEVLDYMHRDAHVALIPREILQAFAYIFDESGICSSIVPATALKIASDLYGP